MSEKSHDTLTLLVCMHTGDSCGDETPIAGTDSARTGASLEEEEVGVVCSPDVV